MNDNELREIKPLTSIGKYVRRNIVNILLCIAVGILLISPDAKAFVLRQLMVTGLFNASIDGIDESKRLSANTNFDFVDEQGKVQNTSMLSGKIVFINFWASWCPPCRAEFPSIERLYSRFKNNPEIFFLTINEDDLLSTGKAYLDKEKFSVPIYQSSGSVPSTIFSGSLPTTVVLDKNGNVRFHHTGFANYASDEFMKQIEELVKE